MQLAPALREILHAGLLAPSADNHHHLRFEPTAEGLRLWSEAGRLATLAGYKRTLELVSLGAVIENMTLRASAFKLETSIDFFPPCQADLIARIRFEPAPSAFEPDPLHAAIPLRHTNRRFFSGPPASHETLQAIEAAVRKIPGCSLDWLDSPERRTKALRLIRLAEGERYRNPVLHAEIFENIRFDLGWHQSCEEALPPGALEVEAPLRPFFRLLRHWPVMRVLNLVGVYWQLSWRVGDLPCRFAPHLGVISAPSLADQDQIDAGRAFERVWLTLAQLGFAVQPMPASALYAHTAAPDQGIAHHLQARLHAGWLELQPGRTPLMVFRTGRARTPSLVSGRHPLDYYLKSCC
jgi:hypothetical protein